MIAQALVNTAWPETESPSAWCDGRWRYTINRNSTVYSFGTGADGRANHQPLKTYMIRADDFAIEIGESGSGTFVRVTHKPTGNERIAENVAPDAVGKTRDSLLAQLRGMLFDPKDIRMDTGRAEGGDFIRVVHIPSGIERWAMRCASTHEELLDQVLEELYSEKPGVETGG